MSGNQNISGPRIKEARAKQNLSLPDFRELLLAGGLELSIAEVEQIEARERTVSDVELLAIAGVLKVSGTSLLFGDDGPPWEKS